MEISNGLFNKSSSWIKRNARPLETAMWEYFFEDHTKEHVIKYLSAFQNIDGGFGHGIEPDFWTPYSSPMATWAAGQILMDIGADKNEKIIKSLISYLVNNYQEEIGIWPSILPENNQYPHAPWWHWQEGVQANLMFNPSAELAAFMVHWSPRGSVGSKIGWAVVEKAVNHVMTIDCMDRHEISNYLQLSKIMKFYEATFNTKIQYSLDEVTSKIIFLAEGCIDQNVSNWSAGYTTLPLDIIDHPMHPLCNKIGDLVEQNLNFFIEQLSEEGIWDISWRWESNPEEFAVARRYWQGILLVKRYRILKSFGLIK